MSESEGLINSDSEGQEEADDIWYTPPERRYLAQSGGSPQTRSPHHQTSPQPSTSGYRPRPRARRERLDSEIPMDYPTSIGQSFERSISGSSLQETEPSVRPRSTPVQQSEPSVRPKVRSTPQPQPQSSPKYSRPPIPEHRTPSPRIVRSNRGETGSPDFHRMRLGADPPKFYTPEATGYELAGRSRKEMNAIYRFPHSRKSRKTKLLDTRFEKDPLTSRWSGSSSSSGSDVSETSERRHLIPSRERDESELFNPRYFRPINRMGDTPRSEIMPVGRLGYGRLDPNYRSMHHSLDDLRFKDVRDDPSDWNPKQIAFARRLRSLSDDHLNVYRDYRDLVDPNVEGHEVVRQRLGRRLTDSALGDINKKKMTNIKRSSLHSGTRPSRRASVSRSASLPSTFGETPPRIGPIREKFEGKALTFHGLESFAPGYSQQPPPEHWSPPPGPSRRWSSQELLSEQQWPSDEESSQQSSALSEPLLSRTQSKKKKKLRIRKNIANMKDKCNLQ